MVCKECGAYNAENLTHCRVCAAKLKDGDNIDMDENEILEGNEQNGSKPSRRFAKAPAWPTKAYDGAKDADTVEEESSEEKNEPEEFISDRPSFLDEKDEDMDGTKVFKAVRETPASTSNNPVCSSCGKVLMEGAPFCPYCGTKVGAAAATAASDFFKNSNMNKDFDDMDDDFFSEKDKKKSGLFSKKAKDDDFFEDDDEEIDDIEPAKMSRKDMKAAKKAKKEEEYDDYFEDDEDIEEFELPKKNKKDKKAAKKAKKAEEFDDYDDDYDDDEYDDDYYDQEFDDDDEPKKKKGSAVLFIILIVVLLGLIFIFAKYIINKNYGGSLSNMVNSISGKGTQATENPEELVESTVMSADDVSATIEDDEVDGVEMSIITIQAPNGSVVKLKTDAELETDSVTVEQDNQIALRVPRAVFLSSEDEYDSTTVTKLPQIEVTLPDGTTKEVYVPAVTITVPQVSLMVTKPESTTIEATHDGSPIQIEGSVDDHTVQVTVNDVPVDVLDGGLFSTTYTPLNQEGEEIRIVAKKPYCMQTVHTISVTPYVVKDLAINITTTDFKTKDGVCTIEGTIPAGTTLTATCENTDLTIEEPVVNETSFTIKCTAKEEGVFNVTINGTAEGYNDGTASCTIESAPTLKASKYKKAALDVSKNYDKLVSGSKTDKQLKFKGKIKEIIDEKNNKIFTMEDTDGHIVYVCCRSEKFEVSSKKIGDKVTAGGYNMGLYPETSCPYIWAWYIWTE